MKMLDENQTGSLPSIERKGSDRYDSIARRFDAYRAQKGLANLAVGVSGCQRKSGVTTLAVNTAIRCADLGFGRVLLVDAHFQFPQVSSLLGKNESSPGLFELASGSAMLGDCVKPTSFENLSIMPAGEAPQQVAFSYDAVRGTLAELRDEFDWIFFDLPLVDDLGSADLFASHLDGVAIVLESNKTRAREANQALSLLHDNGVEIIGTIVNRQKRILPKWIERWL